MVNLVVVIIILTVIACVKIYHATQRQAEREREYVAERKMCGCILFCGLHAAVKAILMLIAAGAIFYIFLSLAINEPIGPHHLASSEFWITAITSLVILLRQFYLLFRL